MQILKFALLSALMLSASAARAVDIVIPVEQDVMTSGFFTGTNLVRGYAGDGRPVHRVSTNQPFGTPGAETVYMTFAYDFQSLGTPVASAILRVDSQSGGFGADATVDDPFLVSVHGLTANPLTSITDDTNPAGPISWTSFYANNILPAAPAARTTVSGFGTIEFDVTDLVNSWISGGNTVHALALTGKNDISGVEFLHGITNDHETAGVSHSLVLSPVPEPSSVALGAMAVAGLGLAAWRRRQSGKKA
jgi:MYXO-CTERM domain-containing protein